MAYTPQSWNNNDPATPLSAARLNYIEAGITAASSSSPAPSTYIVEKVGSAQATATNVATGATDYTGSDVSVVMNSIVSGWGAGSQGGTIDLVPPQPADGPLLMSQRVKIPCDMTNVLIRGNGSILKPTGGNRGAFDVLRRTGSTVGSVAHGDTSIVLTAIPSWLDVGGGYIGIAGDVWHYTGVSGNTLTGAAVQNGSVTDRTGSQTITKAYETWQNITWRGLIIDASGVASDTVQTTMLGTIQGALNMDAHLNMANLWVDGLRGYGLYTPISPLDANSVSWVGFEVSQRVQVETLPNTIENIRVNDFDLDGGNSGVLIVGSCGVAPDTTHKTNIQYGDVRITRGRWDSGLVATQHTYSGGVQVGQDAWGTKTVVLEDLYLARSWDVGIEIDTPHRLYCNRITTVDAYNAGIYPYNFNAPLSDQEIVIENHTDVRADGAVTGSQVGIYMQAGTGGPFRRVIIRDCSGVRTGTQGDPNKWKGIFSDSSFDTLTIDGYKYVVHDATIPNTGSLAALVFSGVSGVVDFPSPIVANVAASLASGTACTVSGILATGACNLRFKGYAPHIEKAAVVGAANGTTSVLTLAGTGAYQGVLGSGMLGTTAPDTTPFGLLMGASTTVGSTLYLPDWDFSAAPGGTTQVSVPAGQATKVSSLVTSSRILDGTILNADVNASAALAVSKLAVGSQSDRLATINSVPTWAKPQFYYLRPSGAIAETVPRATANGTNNPTSGTLMMMAIELEAGMVVSNFNFRTTAGTTMASGTHQWVILTDSGRVMVATTADPATASTPGNSVTWTIAVANISSGASSTYTVPTTGQYYVGAMITAAPMPTFVASAVQAQAAATPPILQGTADTSQTSVKAFPGGFTAATIGATGNAPYCWIT